MLRYGRSFTFESHDGSSIQKALNDLSPANVFSKSTRYGTLRIIKEHSTYYELIVSPVTESTI